MNDQILDIAEVLFRHLFRCGNEHGSSGDDLAHYYKIWYVSLLKEDPPQGFLNRFDDLDGIPKLEPDSENPYKLGKLQKMVDERSYVKYLTDPERYDDPMVQRVSEIDIESDTRATAKAGFWNGPLCAAGYDYILEKIDNKWVIKEEKMDWIS